MDTLTTRGAVGAAVLLMAACVSPPPPAQEPAATPPRPPTATVRHDGDWPALPGAQGSVAGTHASLLVYRAASGDSWEGIAARFTGQAGLGWMVAQANPDAAAPQPGTVLIVPRQLPSPLGVSLAGVQTVPVLCYHRFVAGSAAPANKMLMPAAQFEAQLQWLQREGHRVLRLSELQGFIESRQALPPRAVVLTVDDGWESFHRHAFPLLKQYGVPVTLFVTTDHIGTRDGLSWPQLRELAASGLVDIQAHSKSHRNLAERSPDESEAGYRRAVLAELRLPRQLLERQLADAGVRVRHLAYPFGDVNEVVLAALRTEPHDLAFTVRGGGNAFYAAPHLLRRTMIFGDHTLEDFAARVQTLRPLNRP